MGVPQEKIGHDLRDAEDSLTDAVDTLELLGYGDAERAAAKLRDALRVVRAVREEWAW